MPDNSKPVEFDTFAKTDTDELIERLEELLKIEIRVNSLADRKGMKLKDDHTIIAKDAISALKTIKPLQEQLDAKDAVLTKLRDKFDDLQETYADISLAMQGDEKEVTDAKSKGAQVKFGLSVAEIISDSYKDIPRQDVSIIQTLGQTNDG